MNAVPPLMGPVTTGIDEKSNNDIYYDEPYHGSSANSPNYPLQANAKLRSEGEFASPDEINYYYDRCLSSVPYIEYGAKDGARLQFLIDIGAYKNFISPQIAKGCTPLFKLFHFQSAAGKIEITHQLTGPFFSPVTYWTEEWANYVFCPSGAQRLPWHYWRRYHEVNQGDN